MAQASGRIELTRFERSAARLFLGEIDRKRREFLAELKTQVLVRSGLDESIACGADVKIYATEDEIPIAVEVLAPKVQPVEGAKP